MKKILLLIFIIVAGIGIYLIASGGDSTRSKQETTSEYRSDTLGYSFKYRSDDEGYVIQRLENASNIRNLVEALALIDKDDFASLQSGEREGGEGPPTINIFVFENPQNQSISAWLEANPQFSNYNIRSTNIVETTIAGRPALSYDADGLYANRNVAFADGNNIYIISGSYIDRDSDLYRDFSIILESFQLGQ